MKKRKQNLPRPAVHRMELWWAALPTVPGHVQRGTRPVVIVSNDLGNASSPVVSVVPCTTQRHKPALPTHVYLRGYGLSSGSIAMCEQVMPLDKSCLLRHIGTIYGWYDRLAIQHALATQLGIDLCHRRGKPRRRPPGADAGAGHRRGEMLQKQLNIQKPRPDAQASGLG